jgi:hypothetical protein
MPEQMHGEGLQAAKKARTVESRKRKRSVRRFFRFTDLAQTSFGTTVGVIPFPIRGIGSSLLKVTVRVCIELLPFASISLVLAMIVNVSNISTQNFCFYGQEIFHLRRLLHS